jgi:hypothetical protein
VNNPHDVKENYEHALDSAFHLSRLFGLGEFGLFHWEDCCFVGGDLTKLLTDVDTLLLFRIYCKIASDSK